jgi:hypothetical protein
MMYLKDSRKKALPQQKRRPDPASIHLTKVLPQVIEIRGEFTFKVHHVELGGALQEGARLRMYASEGS